MSSLKQAFDGDYMLLKPREASVVELVRLLFSSKLKNRRFIECTEGVKAEEFRQRWFIFVSVVAQKLLVALTPFWKMVGDMFELWLNRLSSNGGFFRLFLNFLKGKVITPKRSSPEFLSLMGYLDRRVDLDESIKGNDGKYKGLLTIMASKFVYENEQFISNAVTNRWGMNFLGLYNFCNDDQERSAHVMIVHDTKSEPNLIVIAFRGTNPFNPLQMRIDLDISWYELRNVGKMHGGFMKALGLPKNRELPKEIEEDNQHRYAYYTIREEMRTMLKKNGDAKFILTGHSMGGSLAILFVAVLILHEEAWLLDKLEGIYTYGQPRVGDQKFGEFMKEELRKYDVRYIRYVYCHDFVPKILYDDKPLCFKHFGPCLYFDSLYCGQVLEEEEPNKNYFSSLIWVIPKILNTVWEIIRGFVLPFVRGNEYRQSWFMNVIRLVGLIFPGLSAHCIPDYVNVTLLGSLNELPELQTPQHSKAE